MQQAKGGCKIGGEWHLYAVEINGFNVHGIVKIQTGHTRCLGSRRSGLKAPERRDGLRGADFGKETVSGLGEAALAKTHQSQAETEAPMAVGEPLKVHCGGEEQFVKGVGVQQPGSRRHLHHVLVAEDRVLLGGKGAVGALEVLQKTGQGPEVEDTHPLIAQVKERVPRGLRKRKS